jgi:hypothetical protein
LSERQSLTFPFARLSIRGILQQGLSAIAPAEISAYRLKHPTQAIYRSRLACQLARQQFGEELLTKLAVTPLNIDNAQFLTFALEIGEFGSLDFHLSDRSFALWLEQLPQHLCQLKQSNTEEFKENSDDFCFLQYAHARCCSLLRLGHREGLIQLLDPTCSQSGWQWQTPASLTWLDGEDKFLLAEASERHLTLQFLAVADAIDSNRGANWRRLAADLSEAVLAVEGCCRILGEIRQKSPELCQCRLKLLALSQLLLQVLLEEKLGMAAPRKL